MRRFDYDEVWTMNIEYLLFFFIPVTKISLFLSFRSATACLDKIRDQMRRILQLRVSSAVAKEMENAFNTYMRRACDTFDLEKNVEVS